ncbi:MAG: bifunctional phosphopantothenoylcysteine decarboxylase/phosphopantothenate--cysteine ligase CoaBC [Pseudomonadales bacterium]
MHQLTNRNIILGITGGIAAYKAAELVRRLHDYHANVRVVMTAAATEFITPLTLQALSGEAVHLDLLDTEAEAAMGHIELARWADLVLIAPASADFMAKLSTGQADDLLSTLCLATVAPITVAPAMNQAMWHSAATQANRRTLEANGIHLLGPGEGDQACGDVGPGRMLEPDDIAQMAAKLFDSRQLDGVRVVITAGPTIEAVDPVRFLSNHSSGKMGFALAQAAMEAGAITTIIAGPCAQQSADAVRRVDVVSAADMLAATLAAAPKCDIFIGTAAVADYTPVTVADNKIKKQKAEMTLTLRRTEDILATVSALESRPFCVGFAAETNDVVDYARQKLQKKNLDMIVANDVSQAGIGFQSDENAVTVLTTSNSVAIKQTTKLNLAKLLIDIISEHYFDQREP